MQWSSECRGHIITARQSPDWAVNQSFIQHHMSQTNRGRDWRLSSRESRQIASTAVSSAFSHCYSCFLLSARPETLAELWSTATCRPVRIELITARVLCWVSYLLAYLNTGLISKVQWLLAVGWFKTNKNVAQRSTVVWTESRWCQKCKINPSQARLAICIIHPLNGSMLNARMAAQVWKRHRNKLIFIVLFYSRVFEFKKRAQNFSARAVRLDWNIWNSHDCMTELRFEVYWNLECIDCDGNALYSSQS